METARQLLSILFPPHRQYTATITYSGLTFSVPIEAPSERYARQEAERIADGGYIIDFAEA